MLRESIRRCLSPIVTSTTFPWDSPRRSSAHFIGYAGRRHTSHTGGKDMALLVRRTSGIGGTACTRGLTLISVREVETEYAECPAIRATAVQQPSHLGASPSTS